MLSARQRLLETIRAYESAMEIVESEMLEAMGYDIESAPFTWDHTKVGPDGTLWLVGVHPDRWVPTDEQAQLALKTTGFPGLRLLYRRGSCRFYRREV